MAGSATRTGGQTGPAGQSSSVSQSTPKPKVASARHGSNPAASGSAITSLYGDRSPGESVRTTSSAGSGSWPANCRTSSSVASSAGISSPSSGAGAAQVTWTGRFGGSAAG